MQPVDWLPSPLAYALFWINQHQTLLTGIAALFIGVLTVKNIQSQLKQTNDLQEHARQRRHLANIASLPITFVQLIDYAEACWGDCIAILRDWHLYEDWDQKSPIEINIRKPIFPFDTVDRIKLAIESAPHEDANKLADLLGFAQVQVSRFSSVVSQFDSRTLDKTHVLSATEIKRAARDALELRFRASRCLSYSRRRSEHIEPLPGLEAVEEFLFFAPVDVEAQLREYFRLNWNQHWDRITPREA